MAKKGDTAREAVKDIIISAFSATGDFVTFQDKKIYVQAKDGPNGETLQFAISLTMPKTPVLPITIAPAGDNIAAPVAVTPTDLNEEDKKTVGELKQKLIDMGVYKE